MTGNRGVERTINGFKIRFPLRWSRYYQSDYETDNYNFLKAQAKQGMDIIDVGAHIGLFSAVSSKLAGTGGKIICFEPTPGTYEILLQTLKLNKCQNVIPVQGAVSSKKGTAVFYVSETAGCNSNSLVRNKSDKEIKGYDVELFTIDGIVDQYSLKPGLIKIDAEGAELDVLLGAPDTFRQYKPVLILGLHPAFISQKGDNLEKIWDLLLQFGYRVKENDNHLTKTEFCGRTELFDVHCV